MESLVLSSRLSPDKRAGQNQLARLKGNAKAMQFIGEPGDGIHRVAEDSGGLAFMEIFIIL